jgi:pimeloyl-ACP methyl ester carboxylesterase
MRLRFSLLLIAVLLISLVPTGSLQSAPLEQQPLPGSFRPAECPIPPVEGLDVDCGYLTVAESRQNFTGKTIDLAVAILRSPSPNPAPDPIFLLTGGPGQAALPLAPVLAQIYAPMIAERDMVLIDQRGTGYSQPLLSCPQTDLNIGETLQIQLTEDQQRPVFVQQQYQRLIDCGRQLQAQGIDLEAYNSVESAADLEDLRIALGYEQINLCRH